MLLLAYCIVPRSEGGWGRTAKVIAVIENSMKTFKFERLSCSSTGHVWLQRMIGKEL